MVWYLVKYREAKSHKSFKYMARDSVWETFSLPVEGQYRITISLCVCTSHKMYFGNAVFVRDRQKV